MIARFQAILAEEKARRERNVITRAYSRVKRVYEHMIFGLGIYMLEPWEMAMVWISLLVMFCLVCSAILHILQNLGAVTLDTPAPWTLLKRALHLVPVTSHS
ncbi:hypothetical protein F751_5981 [Auxenochlorella protothecoides]|nr:hypothetical protein F751_5981 [Auxenochlorella protothecoides]KFM25440.1 hypothetical protein F751_5981 [Auxenochlorella protothecoides]RMZ53858.1 hypothetical protein APUTEX25_005604 [Auxenochlorella protothecoides]|eukprot:RMZ53858.1 hypothetical protein APUTEX25_005604 [Auxenochlorella protothecoides]